MSGVRYRFFTRFLRQQEGAVAVEFAILVPIFLVLIFGIVDFGHAYYMKQMVSNASREGARYGSRYNSDSTGIHLKPNALNPSIGSYVTTKYSFLQNIQVPTPSGAGYTTGAAGDDLGVTVTATKTWWLIGSLVPGFGSSITLTATTWMKVE